MQSKEQKCDIQLYMKKKSKVLPVKILIHHFLRSNEIKLSKTYVPFYKKKIKLHSISQKKSEITFAYNFAFFFY